jgi:hypothetical protein
MNYNVHYTNDLVKPNIVLILCYTTNVKRRIWVCENWRQKSGLERINLSFKRKMLGTVKRDGNRKCTTNSKVAVGEKSGPREGPILNNDIVET